MLETAPTLAGACQCGAVTYRLAAKSYHVYACHCLECQRQAASAFALSMPMRVGDLALAGNVTAYLRATDSGTRTRCYFCPVCGTRLYHQSERAPAVVTLKAGTLDDTSMLHPVAHLWVRRKQPWIILPAGIPQFETQPGDLARWRDTLLT